MATVLVTGSNRGLGLEFVRQYAAEGWEVLATAREPRESEELKKLAVAHSTVALHKLNVAEEKSVEDLADALDGKPVDVLLHNSGVYPREGLTFGQIDYDGWQEALETNLFGVMRLSEALIENVAASARKQIAAVSSGMASLGSVQGGSVAEIGAAYQYRTSKTALNMALSIMAKELAPRGISVVILDPGWVKTDMGGSNAILTPAESISGMRKVLAGTPMKISGKFLGYDGAIRPW